MANILHLSTAKSWRGGEQQIANLVQELSKKEINQLIVCPYGAPLEKWCNTNNHPCYNFKKRFGLDPLFAWRVYKTSKAFKAEIVHAHDAQAHTTAVFNSFFLLAKPIIVINRRVIFPIKNSFFTKFKYNYYKVKKIICVSRAVQKVVVEIVPENNTTVIPSSVKLSKTEDLKPGLLKEELHISSDTKIIGTVAALTSEKGINTFLDTAKLLLEKEEAFHFVIIGKGKLLDKLKFKANLLNIDKKVSFLGFRNNVKELLLDLDLLLFTSKSEGLGTSLLEACEMNVPIVAFSTGGIPEIITHKETGYLVQDYSSAEFANAVNELLHNSTLRETIIKQAKSGLTAFSTSKMAESTLNVYHHLLGI